MRELHKEEYTEASAGGAFSHLTSLAFLGVGVTLGFFIGGPAGAAAAVTLWGVQTGANALYDVANEGREHQRVENYDYSR